MVLAELGSRITSALRSVGTKTIIDKDAIDAMLKEIGTPRVAGSAGAERTSSRVSLPPSRALGTRRVPSFFSLRGPQLTRPPGSQAMRSWQPMSTSCWWGSCGRISWPSWTWKSSLLAVRAWGRAGKAKGWV